MAKVLLTGFEPFGGEIVNPSWDAIIGLSEVPTNVELYKLRLPVSFSRAPALAIREIRNLCPDVVICVGQAGGRACINVERIAVNLANAKTPDADGILPCNQQIIPEGDNAYFTTVDVPHIVNTVRDEGIPCFPSNSAGLYVCNCLFYHLLHTFPNLPIAFVHIPYSPAQAVSKPTGTPSMSVHNAIRAITAVINSLTAKREYNRRLS